jgi:hypothetical protein
MHLIVVDDWIKKPVFDATEVFPVIDQHGDIVASLRDLFSWRHFTPS